MRKLLAPFLLLLLCIGFYWKLTLTGQYTFLDSPDLAHLDFPRLQFQASAWRHSQLPLWDPNHWVGQPFLGQVTGAAYPANWLLALFPFRDGKLSIKVVHWYLVVLHFQAAWFAYLFCRECKRSRPASILGGMVFAVGGFLGATDWPQILNGALWIPLEFLFLVRAFRGRRPLFSAAMSGAILGLSWLSGHHEVPIYATTAIAGIWLAALLWRPALWRLALCSALALALIAALQVLPAQEYAPLVKRWVGLENGPIGGNEAIPYSVHQHYSWAAAALPGIVTSRPPVHLNPFIGIIAFSLALLGIYNGWRRIPQVRLLVALAGFGLFLAMSTESMLHGVLYAALPVFGKARVPARALVLFSFAIAPLAAYGLDSLRRISSPWLTRTLLVLTALGGLLLLASAAGLKPPDSSLHTALMALLAAAIFAALRSGSLSWRLAACILPFLSVLEISSVIATDMSSRVASAAKPGYLDRLYHHNDIASYLRAQPQPIRVEISDADISYNFGDWHGIPVLGGFAASATSNVFELERHKPVVQDLLGVNYYVGRAAPRPGLVHLSDSASGLNIYKNPAALPRAWIVHRATQLANYSELRARIEDSSFNPRAEALLLSSPPALENCDATEDARISNSSNPNRVRIDVTLGCRGLVNLSDTYFPGWHALVDGRPAPILETYGALRGVVVDAGTHHIELYYRPASAVYGALLFVSGLIFLVWTYRLAHS